MTSGAWADAAATKAQLGRVGVWLGALSAQPWAVERVAARRIEELGYTALWISETPGVKEPFAHAGLLLGATERISLATGIANIWARDAAAARDGATTLAEAHPGRFTLGVGVSHQPIVAARGHDYAKPLTAMRRYLDGLDAIPWRGPAPAAPVPLVLAALRPRMLELARDRAAGAHPYFTPAEHTARARATLGPEPLLAPEVAVVLESDPERARSRARSYATRYLELPNYTNNLRDLGYSDEDLAGGGSDRLIDAVVPWGDEATIARRIGEHFDAGADHVCIQPVGTDFAGAVAELERLAPALLR
ncbi:MAG: family F420-dependent class oxidoreductase [Conexibacter sp.]|nr:family F420-dependent class oxidoreductase [Conexibacter sp.]